MAWASVTEYQERFALVRTAMTEQIILAVEHMESKQRKTRTCSRCKISEILDLSERWVRLFTKEGVEWVQDYIAKNEKYPPACDEHKWPEEEC